MLMWQWLFLSNSLATRQIDVVYHGIDASSALIEIGKKCFPNLTETRKFYKSTRIEDLSGKADHVGVSTP